MKGRHPRHPATLPAPSTRVDVALYLRVREHLAARDADWAEMQRWSNTGRAFPATPDDMAREIVWIILCAGRSAQAARTIEAKVWAAIRAGRPASDGFGYRAKAAAIDRAWNEREQDYAALTKVHAQGDIKGLIAWCGSLPYVGEVTRYQLAKNFGCDLLKPDQWLARLAGIPDRPILRADLKFDACMALCTPLVLATGDSYALVDSALWLACNKGILRVSAEAGPVAFSGEGLRRGSIYADAGQRAEEGNLEGRAEKASQARTAPAASVG